MNPDIKAAWLEALRSGEYQQGRGRLREGAQYCCLGVLCDLHSKAAGNNWDLDDESIKNYYMGRRSHLPNAVADWAGLSKMFRSNPDEVLGGETSIVLQFTSQVLDLARCNDEGDSFQDIANLIEEHITADYASELNYTPNASLGS